MKGCRVLAARAILNQRYKGYLLIKPSNQVFSRWAIAERTYVQILPV